MIQSSYFHWKTTTLVFGFLLLFVVPIRGISQGNATRQVTPEIPMEERVAAYFAAFNSGDAIKMKEFIEQNLTPESLAMRKMEDRLDIYRMIRTDTGDLTDQRLAQNSEHEINVTVKAQKGDTAVFTFQFQPKTPNKVIAIRVERTKSPDKPETPLQNVAKPTNEAELIAEAHSLVSSESIRDRFSGVVLVAKGDRPIYRKAFGSANQENNLPNQVSTRFNFGSLGKSLTQVAIGQLVKLGKISLDDKLGQILVDFPNKDARDKVSVRNLLEMKSGIGDIFNEKFMDSPKKSTRSIKEYLSLISDQPLVFEPGTRMQYSNGGYILLGAIIEQKSGMSYYDYVQKNIFDVVGMKDTGFPEADQAADDLAEGYTDQQGFGNENQKRHNNLITRPMKGSSAGGGYSTVDDLLKYSLALQSGVLELPNGAQARKNSEGKVTEMMVLGGAPGVNASMEIRNGYTVVVLSNYDPPSAETIARQLSSYLQELK